MLTFVGIAADNTEAKTNEIPSQRTPLGIGKLFPPDKWSFNTGSVWHRIDFPDE